MPIINITTIDDIDQSKMHIIAFSAKWCSPCKIMLPIYVKLSNIYCDMLFLKCDVQRSNTLAKHYDISILPTYIIEYDNVIYSTIHNNIDDLIEYLQN